MITQRTQSGYRIVMNHFLSVIEWDYFRPDLVGAEHVKLFGEWLVNEGLSEATIKSYLSRIKSICKDYCEAGKIAEFTMFKISNIKFSTFESMFENGQRKGHKKQHTNYLTGNQAVELKSVKAETPKQLRDKLIWTLLLDHGMRISALVLLDWADVAEDETIRIYEPKHKTTSIHRLTRDSRVELKRYRDSLGGAEPDFIFAQSTKKLTGELKNERISKRGVHSVIKAAGKRIGIRDLGPHDLRHSCVNFQSAAGLNEIQLNYMFGWIATNSMPNRYSKPFDMIEVPNVNQVN